MLKKKLAMKLITALQSPDNSEFPPEFVEMKFCQKFHMTPFEYRALPLELVKSWIQMSKIEDNSKNNPI